MALSTVSFIDAAGKTAFSADNLALPAILDSGTTATYLPDNIVNPILSGVGATNNAELGLIVPCSLSASPANLTFTFGGNGGPTISVPLSEFVTPIDTDDGEPLKYKGETICGFGLMSSETGPILFGDTFLRSAYVVYDLTNNQIGIANTNFNATSTAVAEISGSNIPSASTTATAVAVTQTYTGHPQETLQATLSGGSNVQATGKGTPTFNLGASATGNSGKGAAPALGAPRIEAVTVLTGLVCLLSVVFGGSLVVMM